jgi:hypothetical protein
MESDESVGFLGALLIITPVVDVELLSYYWSRAGVVTVKVGLLDLFRPSGTYSAAS